MVRIWIDLSHLILRDHRLVLSALYLPLVCHCAADVAAVGVVVVVAVAAAVGLVLLLLVGLAWLLLKTEADQGWARALVARRWLSALEWARTHRRRGRRPLLTARTRPSWLLDGAIRERRKRGLQNCRSNESVGGGSDGAEINCSSESLDRSGAFRNCSEVNGCGSSSLLPVVVVVVVGFVGGDFYGGGGVVHSASVSKGGGVSVAE